MPYPRKRVWIVGGIILAACVVLAGAGVAYTSGTEFCLSCHEMRVYQDELKLSSHAKDAQGKDISCSQCHIPSGNLARMLGAKAWLGLKDLWVHNLDGGEDLDRAGMQPVARRQLPRLSSGSEQKCQERRPCFQGRSAGSRQLPGQKRPGA